MKGFEMKFYTKHEPKVIEVKGKDGSRLFIYEKTELNDDFLFKKTRSISITAKILEKSDGVRIKIPHRNVVIKQTKKNIKEGSHVFTFKGETKFYLPVEKWVVESGDSDWVSKL